MKQLFLDLYRQLLATGMLNWVDIDNGQLDIIDTPPPVAWPCALIDISYNTCKDIDQETQQCDATITITLGFDSMVDQSDSTLPVEMIDQALEIYDTVEIVSEALLGFDTPAITPLERTSLEPQTRARGIKTFRMTYETVVLQERRKAAD